MRRLAGAGAILATLAVTPVGAAEPYFAGTIKPNHLSQAELDAQLLDFYEAWKSVYLVQGCGEGRYYVDIGPGDAPTYGGSSEETITVSEAHGYGMLIGVLMAEFDPEAQVIFDGMVAYLRDHPAASDPALLAWNQVTDCSNASEVGGDNTATDGDLDVAYALLLADRFWGGADEIDYAAEARATIDAILAQEVSAEGDFLLIGDWAKGDATYGQTTRSSDFMVSHLKAFSDANNNDRWMTVRTRTYDILDFMRAQFAPDTGLLPDFILDAGGEPVPALAGHLEGETDGFYSWNACRFPWRIGLDYLLNGEPRAFEALTQFNAWARKVTGDDPTKFSDTYRLDGSLMPEHWGNSLAFVGPLGVSAMIDPVNQGWLNAIWDAVVAKKIDDDDYYGNTLKLLTMITMSGHWQAAPRG